jgi:NADPH:quinone reductase-like Zn-dependent oxidoreductase
MATHEMPAVPATFDGIGYTRNRDGLPLESVRVPVPQPGDKQLLIHVVCSSLNPLEYKLAELNFFGRTPPVILGFDMSGIVVGIGAGVTGFAVGDAVVALADSNGDGGWAVGGAGGYALAREAFTAKKPKELSFGEAAALPICVIAAYLGLYGRVRKGDTVYIPGGAGGVGHLAIQIAKNILGAALVISSGSTPESKALASASGADQVFDYKRDDIAAEVARLTGGRGADVVFDATYSEKSFVDTAQTVRRGGTWVVLGVGPGKTTRTDETESPVDGILAERGAHHANANMLRYFTEPATLDATALSFVQGALASAAEWVVDGRVVPHIGKVIDSTVGAINAELGAMKAGKGPLGKIVVDVDKTRAA